MLLSKFYRWLSPALVACVLLASFACSKESKISGHLEKADKYFAEQKYKEAVIEYLNVLKLDPKNTRAAEQIGLAYYNQGDLQKAFPYLVKAEELSPDNLEVRQKLGNIYLLGRKIEDVRREADYILGKDPKNFDAIMLLAAIATIPQDVDAAIARLQALKPEYGDKPRYQMALGTLYMRKGQPAEAEKAFKEAVRLDPQSADAHNALGDFFANQNKLAEAKEQFRTAAGLAPPASLAWLKLADFYLRTNEPEEAKKVLQEITAKAPDSIPAWQQLAQIALAEQKYDESLKLAEVILGKSASNLDALILKGRIHLAREDNEAALKELKEVVKLYPNSAQAQFFLGQALLQAKNTLEAKAAFKEAVRLEPGFVDAQLRMAQIDLQGRDFKAAISTLETIVEKEPKLAQPYLLLGTAHLANNEANKALGVFQQFASLSPKDPRGPYFVGIALRAQGKTAEAKAQFESALVLAPGYLDPLTQLVQMDLADKKPDEAVNRVKEQIAQAPKAEAGLQYLLGRVYQSQNEAKLAEAAYKKAMELNPEISGADLALGQLYATGGKEQEALARFQDALKVNPKDQMALMLTGIIYTTRGDMPQAQTYFEKVLEVNPNFAPAANNLAYIYFEYGGDKEKAFELARKANELAPDDPQIQDTLGWILYSRGDYQWALRLLNDAASKLADNPEVLYHLGMTQLKLEQKDKAKESLEKALQLSADFRGHAEAKQSLDTLK